MGLVVFLIFALKEDVLEGWKNLFGIAEKPGQRHFNSFNNPSNSNSKVQSNPRSQHDKEEDAIEMS